MAASGADVKRQVMEAIREWVEFYAETATDAEIHKQLSAALAPCVVLTAEEAAEIQNDCDHAQALLTPDQEASTPHPV